MKLAAALGIALAGLLLPWLGYVPGAARQSAGGDLGDEARLGAAARGVLRRDACSSCAASRSTRHACDAIQAELAARRPGVVRASGAATLVP